MADMDAIKKPTLLRKLVGFFGGSVVVLFVVCLLLTLFLSSSISWPIKRPIERKKIYSASRSRVEKAGGWLLVQQACLNYVTNGFVEGQQCNVGDRQKQEHNDTDTKCTQNFSSKR